MIGLRERRRPLRLGTEEEGILSMPRKPRAHYYGIEADERVRFALTDERLALARLAEAFWGSRAYPRERTAARSFADLWRQVHETLEVAEAEVFEGVLELDAEGTVAVEYQPEIALGAQERTPEADLDWLGSNVEELRHLYAGRWIAVVDGQVCGSATHLADLMQTVQEGGMATPLVTFVPDQEVIWRTAYDL